MIKIEISQDNKNTVISTVTNLINLDKCCEVWIKERDNSSEVTEHKKKHGNIKEILKQIGVPCHLLGYQYIQDAVRISISDPTKFNKFATIVYGDVASKNKTSPIRVERAIRHAIDVAFKCGDMDEIYKLFGSSCSKSRGKPTNKEFIASLVEAAKEGEPEYEY